MLGLPKMFAVVDAGYYGNAKTGKDVDDGNCDARKSNVCNPCPTGSSSTAGSAQTITDCGCPVNQWGRVTANANGNGGTPSCTKCPKGSSAPAYVPNTDQSVCNCNVNYYGNGRTCSGCTQCPNDKGYDGTIAKQATGDAGKRTTKVTDCGMKVCAKDSYLTIGTSTCQKCFANTPPTCVGTTEAKAKTAYTDCTCAAGYYLQASTKQCVACISGA